MGLVLDSLSRCWPRAVLNFLWIRIHTQQHSVTVSSQQNTRGLPVAWVVAWVVAGMLRTVLLRGPIGNTVASSPATSSSNG